MFCVKWIKYGDDCWRNKKNLVKKSSAIENCRNRHRFVSRCVHRENKVTWKMYYRIIPPKKYLLSCRIAIYLSYMINTITRTKRGQVNFSNKTWASFQKLYLFVCFPYCHNTSLHLHYLFYKQRTFTLDSTPLICILHWRK